MLLLTVPATHKVGDTMDCRINGGPARVTWRDEGTLVIEPGDARVILETSLGNNGRQFVCGGRGETRDDYGSDGPVIFRRL
jgi:hypothetical protein